MILISEGRDKFKLETIIILKRKKNRNCIMYD